MTHKVPFYLLFFLLFGACMRPQKTEFAILQLNDVYEIAPLENRKYAGLARVAQVRQDLLKESPKVFTLLAGDFVSPSLLGTLPDSTGTRLKGKQIVETLNVMGLDYVTFGNHEFDIDSVSLQNRLNESTFEWIGSNVRRRDKMPFYKILGNQREYCPNYVVEEIKQGDKTLKVGFFGLTLPFNEQPYVYYDDFWKTAERSIAELKPKCDVIVAITHLNIADDKVLAQKNPDIQLIVGGHDHTNMFFEINNTIIAKADANAKTVYIHRLSYDWKKKKLTIKPELKKITDKIPHEPKTEAVVQKWLSFSNQSLKKLGYEAKEVIFETKEPLDGHESAVRTRPTNLSKLIVKAIADAIPEAQAVFLNSGSIRIDDMLYGKITQEDILRAMPFGGSLTVTKMKGDILKQVLEIGTIKNVGSGGYLQLEGFEFKAGKWLIGNELIEDNKIYTIATSEFLLEGREQNLHFLNNRDAEPPKNLGNTKNDVRDIVIAYMKKLKKQ